MTGGCITTGGGGRSMTCGGGCMGCIIIRGRMSSWLTMLRVAAAAAANGVAAGGGMFGRVGTMMGRGGMMVPMVVICAGAS